jgi:hypothetical protein
MKILDKITFAIILCFLFISKMNLLVLKKDIKYEPSKDYVDKVSMIQEIDFCIEICTECFNKTNSKVKKFLIPKFLLNYELF